MAVPLIGLGMGLPFRHLIPGLAPPLSLIAVVFALGAVIQISERVRKRALQRIVNCSDPSELGPLLATRNEAHAPDRDVDEALEFGLTYFAWRLDLEDWAKLDAAELDRLKALLNPRVVEGLQLALARNQVLPPWLAYLDQDPWWSGWRQGDSEWWLCQEWLPFWQELGEQERAAYLADWDAPAEWREQLIGTPGPELLSANGVVAHVLNLHRFQ